MSRADKAKELFEGGCNCCQAVFLAFLDETNLSEEDAMRLSAGFGGGMGRMREVCGAVSGMAAAVGAIYAEVGVTPDNKKQVYEIVRTLCDEFKAQCGSLICAELLSGAGVDSSAGGAPEARSEQYYKKRPCDEIVYIAADILEKYLEAHPRG